MRVEKTYINKIGVRRFITKDGKRAQKANEIICAECGGIGYVRTSSLGREENYCSLSCQRKFMYKTGLDHPMYKGGDRISNGYRIILNKKHPYRDRDNYVPFHRLVAEEKIGRYLNSDEVVHHLDGDKLNNNSDNLFICSKSKHKTLHYDLERIAYKLYKENKIKFVNNNYYLCE